MAGSERTYTRYEVDGRSTGDRRSAAPTRAAKPAGRRRRSRPSGRSGTAATVAMVIGLLAVAGAAWWYVVGPPAFVLERIYPLHYASTIDAAASRYGVDPYLVAAVAKAESDFDPAARSSAGAVGVMQIMPETADWLVSQPGWQGSSSPDLSDPVDSIELGAFYLSFLLQRFENDSGVALAAYNAGHNLVTRWLDEEQAAAGGGAEASVGLQDIPFPETRDFVDRVERYRDIYLEGHPDAFDEDVV